MMKRGAAMRGSLKEAPILIALALMLLTCTHVSAQDEVVFIDGTKRTGKIISVARDEVWLKIGRAAVTFPRTKIHAIRRDGRVTIITPLPPRKTVTPAKKAGVTAKPKQSVKPPRPRTRQRKGKITKPWSDRVPLATRPKEYFVAVDGKSGSSGSERSPWDLASVVSGKQKVKPGSIVWVQEGRYENPGRASMSGAAGKPVHLRAVLGQRVTIDGGVDVTGSHLWIWDLELASLKPDWRPARAIGDTSSSAQMPGARGPFNVTGGDSSRFINLVIHNNTMGVGFWKHVKNAEMHGCIIYDNGFPGTDRSHGPGIYTQNTTGTKRLITDNIVAGNFSTGMQMYGSRIDELVNDYHVEGNVFFAPRVGAGSRNYVLCGGGNSQNIVVTNNIFNGYELRVGSSAAQVSVDNIVIRGNFRSPNAAKNRILQSGKGAETIIRPNKYDPRRANLIVINWKGNNSVKVDLKTFLKRGDRFKILDALDFYGKPYAEGTYRGSSVKLPMPKSVPWKLRGVPEKEFWVYIIMKK